MTRARSLLAVLAAALLLLGVTALVGRPSVFSDTDDYYAQGRGVVRALQGLAHGKLFFDASDMGERLAGRMADEEPVHNQDGARSAYYGTALYSLERIGTLWLVAAAQGLLAAWLLFLAWRSAAPGASLWSYAALMGALAAGTTLPFFTGFAMPDVFAGFAALSAVLLLIYPDRLARLERAALWVVLAASINFHGSNLLTTAGVSVIALGVLAIHRVSARALAGRGLMVIAAIAVAVAGAHAFAFAVKLRTGDDLRRPPFLTARVLADGPGRKWLPIACDHDPKLALCRFKHNRLTDTEDILWSDEPKVGIFNSSDYKVRETLEKQETGFVLGAVAHDPVGQLVASLGNWGRQLGELKLDEPLKDPVFYLTDPYWRTTTLRPLVLRMGWCPPRDQGCRPRITPEAIEPLHWAVLALSLAFLGWRFSRRDLRSRLRQLDWSRDETRLAVACALLVLAVVINAAVCGVLSGPFARYQARMAWLVPAAAVVAATALAAPMGRRAVQASLQDWLAARPRLGQAAELGRRELGGLIRFAIVGAGGFLIDALVLKLGLGAGLSPAGARLISLFIAMQFTFVANGWLTFGGLSRGRLPRQWAGYMVANGFGAACNYAIFVALVLSRLPLVSQHLVALAVGSGLALAINYTGTRLLAFGRPSARSEGLG